MKKRSRYIAIGVSLVLICALIYYFSSIVALVLISWVLSMIGQPFMRFFQQKLKIGRFRAGPSLSAILTIFCYIIVFVVLLWMFVPLVIEQAGNLAGDHNSIGIALEEPLSQLQEQLVTIGLLEPERSLSDQMGNTLKEWFDPRRISNFFGSILGAASNFLFSLFSIIFITYFFLKESSLFGNFLANLAPNDQEDEVRQALDSISRLLTRYFGGVLIQMTIITIVVSVLLGLLGVKNALLIGFFAALINVIPYLGPLIGASFGIFITISSNLDLDFYTQMLPLIIRVIAVFGVMQMLDNFLLQPYIFSNSVLAHPLEIFIIILMGAQINGIVGMILAIPAYTVLRVIARVFLSQFKIVQKLTGQIDVN